MTGGRDGCVKVWDVRQKEVSVSPITIAFLHAGSTIVCSCVCVSACAAAGNERGRRQGEGRGEDNVAGSCTLYLFVLMCALNLDGDTALLHFGRHPSPILRQKKAQKCGTVGALLSAALIRTTRDVWLRDMIMVISNCLI